MFAPVPVPFEKAQAVAASLDLPPQVAEDLMAAAAVQVVVVADDSYSMEGARWSELLTRLRQLAHVLGMPHPDGAFKLMFLNRTPPGNAAGDPYVLVRGPEGVDAVAQWASPCGRTPLGRALKFVFDSHAQSPTVCIVMTDGVPDEGFEQIKHLVATRSQSIGVSFCMCTEDDGMVRTYGEHLDNIPGVDVNDDHASEKAEARALGRDLPLNLYLVKCFLGPISERYDRMDEVATPRPGAPAPPALPLPPPAMPPRPAEPARNPPRRSRPSSDGCCRVC